MRERHPGKHAIVASKLGEIARATRAALVPLEGF
jgi:hypothetical protein